MSTSFNRHRAQLRCEAILNCTTPDQWRLADFKGLTLDNSQAALLSADLREDAKDLYFKGALSFFEALKSINSRLFSWATIKIYYSLYYFLRSAMAANDVALIRQKSLFYLRANSGEKPVTNGGKKYNSDHSGTISYYVDLFKNGDVLLSQEIDSMNAYEWIMNRREQVNYRERIFNEPTYSDFWKHIAGQVEMENLQMLLKEYYNDKYVLCFQEENAALAIPFKRALLTKARLSAEGIDISISGEQKALLENLCPFKCNELNELLNHP